MSTMAGGAWSESLKDDLFTSQQIRKQRDRKQRHQAHTLATHFLQLGPTSNRFYSLPREHHQLGLKCPNIISP